MTENSCFTRRPAFWAGVIIAATTLVRLWFVACGQLDLVQDEAQYWDWTRRLQLSYYSKGPLIAYLIALWTKIFGNTELGVRFGAIAGSAMAQAVMYLGVGVLFDRRRAALWLLVIANTMPLFMASGFLMTTDNPLMLCWMTGLFSLYAAASGRWGIWPYVVFAACLALGILAKYMMLAMLVTGVLYALALARKKLLPRGFWPGLVLASVAGLVLGMLPIVVWNAQNAWVGFLHVSHLSGVAGERAQALIRFDRFPEYIASQIGIVSPWWLAFMLVGAWRAGRACLARTGEVMGLGPRRACLLAAGFWPLWGFFLLWSFHTEVYANWPAMSYAAGLVLAALAWDSFYHGHGRSFGRKLRNLWPALGLALFLGLHFQGFLPLPENIKVNPLIRLKGWDDLGRKVGRLQKNEFDDPDRVFVFSGTYDMTAELAFYTPGQPRTYCVYTGRRLSQYDLWPGPEDRLGWDAVYVRKGDHERAEQQVRDIFDHTRRIYYRTTHKGRPGREFTIFLCYNYKGPWPKPHSEGY